MSFWAERDGLFFELEAEGLEPDFLDVRADELRLLEDMGISRIRFW